MYIQLIVANFWTKNFETAGIARYSLSDSNRNSEDMTPGFRDMAR